MKDDQIGLKALIAGEVDSFEGGPQGAFAADGARRRRQDHRLPLGGAAARHLRARRHPQVEDLKGKSIAVSSPNTMPDLLARAALAKYGITADQVKLAAVGGDRERYQALAGGVVEGAVVSNEYAAGHAEERCICWSPDATRCRISCASACMTSGKMLKERGDDVVQFLAAEMQGLRFAIAHKAETVALTQEIIHAKPDDPRPAFVYDDAVAHHAIDPELPIPADKLNWIAGADGQGRQARVRSARRRASRSTVAPMQIPARRPRAQADRADD